MRFVSGKGYWTPDRWLAVVGALGVPVLLALGLRAFHIGTQSLWLDETGSVFMASKPLGQVLAGEPTNPPLYYILLHLWIKVVGTGEASVRWLSVGSSVGAIPLVYALARRLYDDRVAVVASVFMAISPYQIYYAQEARAFALLQLLCVASTLAFYVAVTRASSSPSLVPWCWYAVSTIAALHAHFHAVFVVAAQNLFFLVYWSRHRHRLRQWIFVQAVVVTAFLPWLLTMVQAASSTGGQVRRYLALKLPEAVASFLVGDTLIPFDEAAVQNIRETLVTGAPLIAAFTLGFGIYFASAALASAARPYPTAFCAAMGLVPLVVPFLVSYRLMIFDRRYVIAASPFFYIVLALGAVRLHRLASDGARRTAVIHSLGTLLVVAVLGISLYNYYFNPRFGKEQWREVVAFVEAGYRPADVIVFDPGYLQISYNYYSRRRVSDLALANVGEEEGPGWRAAASVLAGHDRVWLVRSHLFTEAVLSRLRRSFRVIDHRHFARAKGIDVYLLER